MKILATICLLVLCPLAGAAPPKLEVPAEVKPSQGYVRMSPTTDAVSVVYVSLDGVYPFPSEELADKKRFLLPVGGIPAGRYRFVAVAASATGEQSTASFTAVIGDAPKPPDPDPYPPVPAKIGEWLIMIGNDSVPAVSTGATVKKYTDRKKFRLYQKTADAANLAAKGYTAELAAKKIAPPALLVLDGDGNPVLVDTIPETDDALAAKIAPYMKP